jgi:hypothetical protein
MFVAWTGVGAGALNVARVDVSEPSPATVLGISKNVTLPETSAAGPAISGDENGNIFLAWTGQDEHLNLAISADRGATWPQKFTFDETSSHGPALISHAGGRLMLAWKGSGNENLNVARVQLESVGNPSSLVVKGLLKKMIVPDTSDYAPSVATYDDLLLLAWTGEGAGSLNLAGPVGDTSAYGKRVFESETSDDGPALTSHRSRLLLAYRGSGNEDLNVVAVRERRRLLDDFTTGDDRFDTAAAASTTRTQAGSMFGGARTVRVDNRAPDGSSAQVNIGHSRLALMLGANHDAGLEVGYRTEANLRDDGADRFRVALSRSGQFGVELQITVVDKAGNTSTAGAFIGDGPSEVHFADFVGAGPNPADFASVNQVAFGFHVVGTQPGVLGPDVPVMRLDEIETRRPGIA